MADADALRALIERVEAATGPDRDLDALIMVAAGAATEVNPRSPTCVRRLYANGPDDLFTRSDLVTSSLDAAVALVERALSDPYWRVGRYTHGFFAEIDAASAPTAYGSGPTAALALCAALLRALLALAGRPNP